MKLQKLLATCTLLVSFNTLATIYEYTNQNQNGVSANYRFDSVSEVLNLTFDVDASDGVDGFWFVLNDGPAPAADPQGDLSIFFSDLSDIWAYQYTDQDNSNDNTLLEKWDNTVSVSNTNGVATISFELDASSLNALNLTQDWAGVAFDEMIGTWLHPTLNTFDNCGGSYEQNGSLNCFNMNNWIGWDESNGTATPVASVSEPSAVLLLCLGVLGLAMAKRRKSVKAA